MMREIIHRVLEDQGDIAVTWDDALPSPADGASVVIITAAPAMSGVALPERLLDLPRHRVLVLASDGRDAAMHEARVLTTVYSDIQPCDLLAAIRQRPDSG